MMLVVDAKHLLAVEVDYSQLIEPRLLPKGHLSRLELPQFSLSFTNGGWLLEPTSETQTVSADTIARWVEEWRHARAFDVRPLQQRIISEVATIEMLNSGKSTTIQFGIAVGSEGPIWQRHDLGIEYHMTEKVSELLQTNPSVVQEQTEE